jgi:hypothetical protein
VLSIATESALQEATPFGIDNQPLMSDHARNGEELANSTPHGKIAQLAQVPDFRRRERHPDPRRSSSSC